MDKKKEFLKKLQKASEKKQFSFVDVFRRLYNEFCPECRQKIFVKVTRKTKEGKTITYDQVVNTLCSKCMDNAIKKTTEAGELL